MRRLDKRALHQVMKRAIDVVPAEDLRSLVLGITASAQEYARAVHASVSWFCGSGREELLQRAARMGTPPQRDAMVKIIEAGAAAPWPQFPGLASYTE